MQAKNRVLRWLTGLILIGIISFQIWTTITYIHSTANDSEEIAREKIYKNLSGDIVEKH